MARVALSAAVLKSGSEERFITAGSAASEPSWLSFTRTVGTGGFCAACNATGTTQHLCSCSWISPTSASRCEGLRRCALPVAVPSEAVRLSCGALEPVDCEAAFEASSERMSPALKFLASSACFCAFASASALALASA